MFTLALAACLLAFPTAGAAAVDAATPNAAPPNPSASQEKLQQATLLVDALEYERARDLLLELLADPGLDEETRFQTNMQAGIVQRVMGNDVDARLHFVDALKHNPDAVLPLGQPPKIISFFELVKREQRPAAMPDSATLAAPVADDGALTAGTMLSIGGASVAVVCALVGLAAAGAAAGSYYGLMATTLDKDVRSTGRASFFAALGLFGAALFVGVIAGAVGVAGVVIE